MTTKTPNPRSELIGRIRPRPLIILDVTAAVLLTGISLIFMLFLIGQSDVFPSPFGTLLVILSVLSWFGGTSLFVLFYSRNRYGAFWTIIGIVAMFAFYYLLFFLAVRVNS